MGMAIVAPTSRPAPRGGFASTCAFCARTPRQVRRTIASPSKRRWNSNCIIPRSAWSPCPSAPPCARRATMSRWPPACCTARASSIAPRTSTPSSRARGARTSSMCACSSTVHARGAARAAPVLRGLELRRVRHDGLDAAIARAAATRIADTGQVDSGSAVASAAAHAGSAVAIRRYRRHPRIGPVRF